MKKQFEFSKVVMRLVGNSGMALAAVMIFTVILLILGAAFLKLATDERILANNDVQRAQSFYLAEAGVQRALAHLKVAGNEYFTGVLYLNQSFGSGTYSVTVADDIARGVKIVTSTGNFAGEQKTITVEIQLLPAFFKNTFSSGGDLDFYGIFAAAYAHGTTWLTGQYDRHGWFLSMGFDTKVEGVSADQTTLRFPDMDNNGTINEFNDFVLFFQNEVQQYDPSEVVWLQTDGTVQIWPSGAQYSGKKIIFVEGSAPGAGDVEIFFGASWGANQDLTIVSTGEVIYIQPLQNPDNSRLSVISWGDYAEGAIIYSSHTSVIGTQGTADFTYLLTLANVTGSIFANEGIDIREAVVLVNFWHDSRLNTGDVPPGLKPLCGNNYYLGEIISWED
ncbi:MAG: hypothetical protein KJ887_07035 [Candidatus Omnitrophica bacterium]|nr:hypothetical protein [Candidatus Omnitrophota bacterium]MBU1047925.1 hypothetical protein [Candidatus Omnitrophota bacterium]MBU1630342.1 hypothetical protein [Candidatus Omnitrophota bacterium]MBU1889792.1 hypothetical protein [Candidatus Omnitrophota bacterium]